MGESRATRAKTARAAGAPEDADLAAGLATEAEAREAGEQAGDRSPRYTVAQLKANTTILLESRAVITGALLDYDDSDELTKAEAEKVVRDFLAQPEKLDTEEA